MPLRLTDAQVRQYHEDGFTTGIPVLTADEVRRHRAELEAYEARTGGPLTFPDKSKCHLLFNWADAIVNHKAVLDAVEDVIGPNILLFHFTLQTKEAHRPTFAEWHQDDAYFHLSPAAQVTAWVALSDASEESGCMRMIPGSHKSGLIDHFDKPGEHNIIRRGQTVSGHGPKDGVLAPVKAGEMSLHHTHTLHSSGPNNSSDRRIGLTLSYIPTHVRPLGKVRPTALLVRGEDKYGYYDLEKRLDPSMPEAERIAVHEQAVDLYTSLAGITP